MTPDADVPAASDDAESSDPAPTGGDASLREVPREVAAAFAEESGLLFFETSAKSGNGVGEIFTEIGAIPLLECAR